MDLFIYRLFIQKDNRNCLHALNLLEERPGWNLAVEIIYVDAFLKSENLSSHTENNLENDTSKETKRSIQLVRELYQRLKALEKPLGIPVLFHIQTGQILTGSAVLETIRNADFSVFSVLHSMSKRITKLEDLCSTLLLKNVDNVEKNDKQQPHRIKYDKTSQTESRLEENEYSNKTKHDKLTRLSYDDQNRYSKRPSKYSNKNDDGNYISEDPRSNNINEYKYKNYDNYSDNNKRHERNYESDRNYNSLRNSTSDKNYDSNRNYSLERNHNKQHSAPRNSNQKNYQHVHYTKMHQKEFDNENGEKVYYSHRTPVTQSHQQVLEDYNDNDLYEFDEEEFEELRNIEQAVKMRKDFEMKSQLHQEDSYPRSEEYEENKQALDKTKNDILGISDTDTTKSSVKMNKIVEENNNKSKTGSKPITPTTSSNKNNSSDIPDLISLFKSDDKK